MDLFSANFIKIMIPEQAVMGFDHVVAKLFFLLLNCILHTTGNTTDATGIEEITDPRNLPLKLAIPTTY
jgi:hypothetical protein